MAIRKNAKNMTITVKSDYNLTVGGKLEKIAEKINIEAVSENLILSSNKKIISKGKKK